MKFSFQHRAFYCYLVMTLWILFLVTAMYRYMGLRTEEAGAKRRSPSHLPRGDGRLRRLRSVHCHPPDEITRGTEGALGEESWQLRGVLAVTRHGDRGPLTHLRGGDALPCNTVPASAALRNYSEYVWNVSAGGRAPWVQAPGPFHNFPTLPVSSPATSCALGQLTLLGVQQMLATESLDVPTSVATGTFPGDGADESSETLSTASNAPQTRGEILNEAYAERLGWLNNAEGDPTKQTAVVAGEVLAYSTRYRRTFQSALALLFALLPRVAFPARAAALRESHTVSFCFRECACPRAARLQQRLSAEARARLESQPMLAALVAAMSRVVLAAPERPDADVLRDALLATVCHRAPLPCADMRTASAPRAHRTARLDDDARLRDSGAALGRHLLSTEVITRRGDTARGQLVRVAQEMNEDTSMKRIGLDIDTENGTEYTPIETKLITLHDEVENNDKHLSQSLEETLNYSSDKSLIDEDFKEPTIASVVQILGSFENSTQETFNTNDDLEIPPHEPLKNTFQQAMQRRLKDVDIDMLNLELDYINNQLDFNNEIGRKARDIIAKTEKAKPPLDFDAQMEKEKLSYYKQRYMENGDPNYDDVVVVKKHLDSDFNFNLEKENEFEDDSYQDVTPQDNSRRECVRQEQLTSLFAFIQWNRKLNSKSINNKKKATLNAYGFIDNIVKNMIRMISEHKPKFVYYSGHDKTIQALVTALGLSDYGHLSVSYASRMIFEVYRRAELRAKRKAVAQDFYFRTVLNGKDVTDQLSFCRGWHNVAVPTSAGKVFLCPIENIVRFIHDDYFAALNATNFKDACASR